MTGATYLRNAFSGHAGDKSHVRQRAGSAAAEFEPLVSNEQVYLGAQNSPPSPFLVALRRLAVNFGAPKR
jgi:hypothetical protein